MSSFVVLETTRKGTTSINLDQVRYCELTSRGTLSIRVAGAEKDRTFNGVTATPELLRAFNLAPKREKRVHTRESIARKK